MVSVKRILDVVIVIGAASIIIPVTFLVAVLVRKRLGSPVLFTQWRPGLNGKVFKMMKFRSMRDAQDDRGQPLPDAERITPFGTKLRATSLDELPALWNVLCGDMSLVGPRPLLVEYLPLYSTSQSRRHNVRPGITGWAQINGRNAISWNEKFELDVWYVEHQSLWLDIRILCRTLLKVVRRDSISADGEATMPKFTGKEKV